METTALTIADAMHAMSNGKITADEYRAVMRTARESMTEAEYNSLKLRACALLDRA